VSFTTTLSLKVNKRWGEIRHGGYFGIGSSLERTAKLKHSMIKLKKLK
jgi:hypothetical protein